MAQTGFTPIQLYRTATASAVPLAGNLSDGELALNTNDGRLYYKDSGGTVQVIAYKNVPLSTVTGTLAVANGGTGQTTLQAAINSLAGAVTSGQYLRGNGTNVVMSAIQAADVPTLNQNTTGTASNVTGTVAVANGGTGLSSTPANGALDIGNGSGFTRATLTAGSGVSISNGAGSITISATGSGGTVTSVSATAPVASSGGTAPTISLNSAYGDTLNPYGSKTANFFLAAPNGSAGAPTFRAIVAADIPTLNQNTTGTASNVTGTVAVANGGTGGTTQATARTGIGATTVGGNFFTLTNPSAVTFPRINADNTVSALDAATFRSAIGAGTSSTTGTVTSVGATGGTGISVSGSPITSSGSFTITNTGVTSVSAGTGISVSASTGGVTISASGGGGFSNLAVFTSSGSWSVPAGVTKCKVTVTGGGGAGSTTPSSGAQGPSGGGAGGTAIKIVSLSGGTASITIGSGASQAGAGGGGGSGGNSEFVYSSTTVTGNGGGGGGYSNRYGGTGGAASGGDINIRGGFGSGMSNATATANSVMGGASFWGGCSSSSSDVYGAGGAGIQEYSGLNGGGAPGIVVIEY